MDNNTLGGMATSGLGFWFGKTPDCDTDCKEKVAEDVAKENAVVSAGLVGTVSFGGMGSSLSQEWVSKTFQSEDTKK